MGGGTPCITNIIFIIIWVVEEHSITDCLCNNPHIKVYRILPGGCIPLLVMMVVAGKH